MPCRIIYPFGAFLLIKLSLAIFVIGVVHANNAPGLSGVVEAPLVHETVDGLLYDENGKLSTHYVLYPFDNEANCGPEELGAVYGFETRAVSGLALEAFFPERNKNFCEAVCVERGTDRSLVQAVMPHKRWQKSQSEQTFQDWFDTDCRHVEVCLLQYHSKDSPVLIYWVPPGSNDDEDGWQKELEVSYGDDNMKCFSCSLGEQFAAVEGNQEYVIEKFRIEHITTRAIGNPPPYRKPANSQIEAEVEGTLHMEWNNHNRVKRTFSELGFKKGRLPDDIFASMGAFYYNNRQYMVLEDWDFSGFHVNWWETDVFLIHIPSALKEIWQMRLLELVEAWAGVPIEQTSLYGVRQYESGSRLLTHVDRITTHAVSLIVNIAQGNLAESWAVEVHDHADRLHDVMMEPGDIVYYESAKALHGRNRPLQGEGAYYVNLFTHYRPIDDPEWFKKDNPPGVPEPILEIQGQCRLETVAMPNVSATPASGTSPPKELVQAVQCDDPRLGPYVSPTFFQATNAQDLIDWWHWTSPTSFFPETPLSSSYTVNNNYDSSDAFAEDDENVDGNLDEADDSFNERDANEIENEEVEDDFDGEADEYFDEGDEDNDGAGDHDEF